MIHALLERLKRIFRPERPIDRLVRIVSQDWFIITALTLLAAALRFWALNRLPVGLLQDEALNGNEALYAWRTGRWQWFYPANFGREGLFINLQAIAMAVFGAHPWVLRLVSAKFGALTIPAVYLLTVELFRGQDEKGRRAARTVALLAAFLTATGFWHLSLSRLGLSAVAAPFFLCWSLWLLLAALNRLGGDPRRVVWAKWLALAGGVIYGLGFHIEPSYRVTPLIVAVILWQYWRVRTAGRLVPRRGIGTVAGLFTAGAAATVAPLVAYFARHPADFWNGFGHLSVFADSGAWSHLALNTVKFLTMFHLIGDPSWRQNVAGRPELYWPVGLLLLAGIVVARWAAHHRADRPDPDRATKIAYGTMLASLPFCAGAWLFWMEKPGSETLWAALTILLVVGTYVMASLTRERGAIALNAFDAEALRRGCRTLLAWTAVVAVLFVTSGDAMPNSLRAVLLIPPVFMFAALGGTVLIIGFLDSLENDRSRRFLPLVAGAVFLALTAQTAHYYFTVWAGNPSVREAFSQDMVNISQTLEGLPYDVPKNIVVNNRYGKDEARFMLPQTIMFMTDTYAPDWQRAKMFPKNYRYLEAGPNYKGTPDSATLMIRVRERGELDAAPPAGPTPAQP